MPVQSQSWSSPLLGEQALGPLKLIEDRDYFASGGWAVEGHVYPDMYYQKHRSDMPEVAQNKYKTLIYLFIYKGKVR